MNLKSLTKQVAKSSNSKIRVGAVVVDKKGRILSYSTNSYKKTHPRQAELARRVNQHYKIYLHAEIAALVKCRSTPHTVFIVRVNNRNNLRLARPCQICLLAMREAGVKKIVYSTNSGAYNTEEVI